MSLQAHVQRPPWGWVPDSEPTLDFWMSRPPPTAQAAQQYCSARAPGPEGCLSLGWQAGAGRVQLSQGPIHCRWRNREYQRPGR